MSTPSWRPVLLVALSLALPMGLADPIDVPPVTETLVEGHVVFATIDAYPSEADLDARAAADNTRRSPVEVLEPQDVQLRIERFPGVLWFNDQYLLPPDVDETEGLGAGTVMRSNYGAAMAILVRGDDGSGIREPCGGAIIAVNAGDPIPRSAILALDGTDAISGEPADTAWVGLDGTSPYSDGVVSGNVGALLGETGLIGYDYDGSYRIKDVLDRVFVVDKYVGIVRLADETVHAYPFWVTNLHGTEAFVPDVESIHAAGIGPGHCQGVFELEALASDITLGGGHENLCGIAAEGLVGLTPPGLVDDPCMSYMEPTRSGHCYPGSAYAQTKWCDRSMVPLRRYHALLYFEWQDVVPSGYRDHCSFDPQLPGGGGCNPAYAEDTTGCQSGTEWPCPGEEPWIGIPGHDELEGNSHTAHPLAPPHAEAMPCPIAGHPNPTNHGGSTNDGNWNGTNVTGPCDYLHATANVEAWYSPTGRPAAPAVRYYRIDDLVGSSEAFADLHTAYPKIP